MTRRRSVARHEAAHAVLAARFGLDIVRVSITSHADELEGYSLIRCPRSHDLAVGVTLAAGEAADRIYRHRDAGELSSADRAIAAEHGLGDAAWRHLVGLARHYLRGEVSSQWLAITEALLERDLTGAEVTQFVIGGVPIDL